MIVGAVGVKRLIGFLALCFAVFAVAAFQENRRLMSEINSTPTQQPMLIAPPTVPLTPTPPIVTFVAPTVAPSSIPRTHLAPYPIYGPAAELRDTVWLNASAPIHIDDLRGHVVLLVFWAFDCLPCMPTLAFVNQWNAAYTAEGLSVIGVHFPKVAAEKSYNDLAAAIKKLGIEYPVAQDNDGLIWNAYGQGVWPTLSLIDKRGYLRYQQVGAGSEAATEAAIQALLAES